MRITPGSTDQSVIFNLGTAGLTITDLDLYYCRLGSAMSAKVDAIALASATAAHTDNAAFDLGCGLYRVDFPDAAFAVGTNEVDLIVKYGDTDYETLSVELEIAPTSASDISTAVWSDDNRTSTAIIQSSSPVLERVVGSSYVFAFNTFNPYTGVAQFADSAPVYRVYALGTSGVIHSGICLQKDSINCVGLYYISATISSDFAEDYYYVEVTSVVEGITTSAIVGYIIVVDETLYSISNTTLNTLAHIANNGVVIVDNGITSSSIADGAITGDKIASGAITATQAPNLNAAVGSIPTNPLLTTDSRLNNLNAPVGSIPTSPLLSNDSRLNYLDASVSSRLASSGYTTPPSSSDIASAVWSVESAPTPENVREEIDANSTKLIAIKAKTDNITDDAATQSSVDAIASVVDNNNTLIGDIKNKTDNLPSVPASQSDVETIVSSHQITVTFSRPVLSTTGGAVIICGDDYLDAASRSILTTIDNNDLSSDDVVTIHIDDIYSTATLTPGSTTTQAKAEFTNTQTSNLSPGNRVYYVKAVGETKGIRTLLEGSVLVKKY